MIFKIQYNTVWGESLVLCGQGKKYPMKWGQGNVWKVEIKDPSADFLKQYGYVVVKDGLVVRTEWDWHSAKKTKEVTDSWIDCPIVSCPFERKHQNPKFDVPGFRGAGTAVPVFSLRSEKGFGIGEFNDLKALVDWAVLTGQTIIQLLPVNDTTRKGGWEDSYPYSPVSSFALNPMYINLQDLGIKEDKVFLARQKELNDKPELDYPAVYKAKRKYVRKAFDTFGVAELESRPFRKFCKDNAFWLDEYALFCSERDNEEQDFFRWVQFKLEEQFGAVVDYARKKGVSFKGDLPIGVSRDSAEARFHPELFNLDSCAGAPPDFFSRDGQNWGFPTYNWDAMAKNDYAWWKMRLVKMSRFFDAFRIDHILGFFRIWEIPFSVKSGMYGHFNPAIPYRKEEILARGLPLEPVFHEDPRHPGLYQPVISPDTSSLEAWQKERFDEMYNDFFFHRHNEFWRVSAEKKLPELLMATGMLACGEDLGMVPECVNGVMQKERILSLEMACMDKGRPWPYLSVCATSSHDMETLRMQHHRKCACDMTPREVRQALWAHLSSASMLAIFPIQDWLGLDASLRREDFLSEQINNPADSAHHWRFRIHLNVGDLLSKPAENLNSEISDLLKNTNR